MKPRILALILLLAWAFESCEPTATFDRPQPADKESLTSFPSRMQGRYLSTDQSTVLVINDQRILIHAKSEFNVHKDSLGSQFKLVGDTLFNLIEGSKKLVSVNGDSIIQQEAMTDTLFSISSENVLKKFKGYCFLNSQYQEKSWETKKLSLKNGVLTVGVIANKEEIQKLNELTETAEDTVSAPFSLSRRQFRKFVKGGGFQGEETFTKIAAAD